MDTHPRYALVGLIVVIIITLLGFWVSWLWRGDSSERNTIYGIYFTKQSLSGLQIESIVTMRGIKVGSVKTVAIDPKNIERIRVTIALKQETPVKVDTRAVINRNLLTGLAAIDLVGSSQFSKSLLLPPEGEDLPIIEEGQTGLEQVQQSLPEFTGKAGDILNRLELVLSDQNIQHFSNSLDNLEKASAALGKLDGLINSANNSFASLSEILNKIKPIAPAAVEDFAKAMSELKQAAHTFSNELAGVLRSVKTTSAKLAEPRSSVLGLASGKLGPGEEKTK